MKTELEKIIKEIKNPQSQNSIATDGTFVEIQEQQNGKFTIVLKILDDRATELALDSQIRTALSGTPLQEKTKIKFLKSNQNSANENISASAPTNSIPGVDKIILVGSGKGGVGKSTVTLNLGQTLVKMGYKVGLLDADIYGPSLGKMLGLPGRQNVIVKNDTIMPLEAHGLKVISFSFLIDEDQPVAWRGPMLGKTLQQFLYDIEWGKLDFLIIDLPPGTGDTQLSLAQLVKNDAAIVVTTPQSVAILDAQRAVTMFNEVNVPVAGIIENMSEYICPHCHKSSHIFSKGGGSQLAQKYNSVLLGQIPLTQELMQASENGTPLMREKTISENAQKIIDSYEHAAKNILSILMQD